MVSRDRGTMVSPSCQQGLNALLIPVPAIFFYGRVKSTDNINRLAKGHLHTYAGHSGLFNAGEFRKGVTTILKIPKMRKTRRTG
jgi:hypothetical protein